MNIGVIGLGNIGAGIAANILKYCQQTNDKLVVFDINKDALLKLSAQGAINGKSIANLCMQCDVLFTSLPSAKEINLLTYGSQGILSNLKHDSIWFETSTNELGDWKKTIKLAPKYLTLVDAPVSGGVQGAIKGVLTLFLGAKRAVYARYLPILKAFSKKLICTGSAGNGYVTKIIQLHLNYLVAQGIGEALMLGAKADLDLTTLYKVLKNSCSRSYVVENYIPKVLDGSYDDSFSLGLATKDTRLISKLGRYLGVDMPLADKVCSTYEHAKKIYGFDAPHLSVIRLIEEKHSEQLRS